MQSIYMLFARYSLMPVLVLGLLSLSWTEKQESQMQTGAENSQFYTFEFETLAGKTFRFSDLRGKRVLVVNTASECGFTGQYEGLQELYEEFADKGFTVIGFPSNNFGGQEPGSNEEIASFCQVNYGVTFPLMAKSEVKGKDINPLFAWLTDKEQNGVSDAEVTWNFNKFLIDENGKWVAHYTQSVEPLDERIIAFAQGESQ